MHTPTPVLARSAEPLTWSQRMADSALRHASKCIWEHSTFTERGGAGENMYYSIGYDVRSIGARATQVWRCCMQGHVFSRRAESVPQHTPTSHALHSWHGASKRVLAWPLG